MATSYHTRGWEISLSALVRKVPKYLTNVSSPTAISAHEATMREITCEDGMRWRVVLVAETGKAQRDDIDVVLLQCSTCDGEEQHVTIRSPHHDWVNMSGGELCRLITDAHARGTATA